MKQSRGEQVCLTDWNPSGSDLLCSTTALLHMLPLIRLHSQLDLIKLEVLWYVGLCVCVSVCMRACLYVGFCMCLQVFMCAFLPHTVSLPHRLVATPPPNTHTYPNTHRVTHVFHLGFNFPPCPLFLSSV